MPIPRIVENIRHTSVKIVDLIDENGNEITLQPGASTDLLNLVSEEDLADSTAIIRLEEAGNIKVKSYFSMAKMRRMRTEDWILSNDLYIQFSPSNGPAIDNEYAGTVGQETTIDIVITNGQGTTNIINSQSTCKVSVTGGTATGKVNGGTEATVNFNRGEASVKVTATGTGTVTLGLKDATHPFNTLKVIDTATVTFT